MNTSLFLQKLDTLKNRPLASLPALEAIQRWVLEFSDTLTTQRLNPIKIAAYANLPVNQVVPEFLHAIPIGLFDLNWEVHCPHCHAMTAGYQHLSQAAHHAYCQGCQKEFEADFARWVDVTFSLNPEIDDREFTPVCKLPEETKIFFNLEVPFMHTDAAIETIEECGYYRYVCPLTRTKGLLTIAGNKTDQLQEFALEQLDNNEFNPPQLKARPGPIKISLTNRNHPISGLGVFKDDLPPTPLPPHLSGLELIHYPEFRTLFGDQVLSEREPMQIASVTTLFTDITGSTEMYEKLGDIVAYNIVRDHFDILFTEIEKQGGTVLKTIGDAIMASFIRNDSALFSVTNALENFQHYNNILSVDKQINIKVGIHRGSAILVNLNDKLDYFGSTINKAARIQALASSGEICFSESVYQDEAFKHALKKLGIRDISRHSVNLKGIEGVQTVYKAITSQDKMVLL